MLSFILNIPYTLVGILITLISLPRLKIDFNTKHLAIIVYVQSFWWANLYMKGVRAMTIGNVVLIGQNTERGDLKHELVHIEQYKKFPIIFPILYYLELFKKGYKNNKYEIEAYTKSGNFYKGE